ncbi:MAG: 2-oxoacid:acceptor oxidoreductase subunit alpha [Oryzomonas sp.]|uniref:2-oxoacid:acceptor oxidoreductase subunit alpha n=1 Tax=Oryzomonas sp. TaxID=2855186 RepID=UPI00284A9CC9|nr:2-oxoacid:acceptor oxidoreductase subunit alpha [Oryzomonas sp.]MDR3580200.1 2-oxoacid:acceptor oxidoreductase subunit alpha [Oryzomonas sp.]
MTVTSSMAHSTPSTVVDRVPIVNDFSITTATVNGSGSQTANNTLLRAIHKMGVPVNGKNIFPSNIQGLPTWFTIRVSKDGYLARCEQAEILVAMNKASSMEDIQNIVSGGICLYPADFQLPIMRDDVTFYQMPVNELVMQSGAEAKLKPYVANMVYVGTLAYLLNIDLAEIEAALSYNFNGKQKAMELNYATAKAAYDWADANLDKIDPFRIERMSKTAGTLLIDGNTAAALGAIFGGVQFVAWYPITPSTSIVDNLSEYLPKLRREADGKATYAIVQAEDELAVIGMVVGAGWAGARSMTATSGPGLSLMTEFVGYAYFAEIPAVIWDVQRMGPSTGLPTRVAQDDLLTAYTLGHGDGRHVCLIPASIAECFEFGGTALDLAERLQTPVIVLSDLDLGLNLWPTRPFEYPTKPLDRGKVLSAEDLTRLQGEWQRYADIDGDGICYRTLPGTNHPAAAYFTRGTGHNEAAGYSERPEDWSANLSRLAKKHDYARTIIPAPVTELVDGAGAGIISYGTNDPAVQEARDILKAAGISTSYLRLRALPLESKLTEFIQRHKRIYVIENNLDGQMHSLIQLHTPADADRIISVAKCDGLPLTAHWIRESIVAHEAKEQA